MRYAQHFFSISNNLLAQGVLNCSDYHDWCAISGQFSESVRLVNSCELYPGGSTGYNLTGEGVIGTHHDGNGCCGFGVKCHKNLFFQNCEPNDIISGNSNRIIENAYSRPNYSWNNWGDLDNAQCGGENHQFVVLKAFAGFIIEASFDLGTFILGGIGLTIIWAAFSALNQIKFIDNPINKVVDTIVLFTMGFLPKALKRGIAKFVKFLIFCVIIWFIGFPLGIGYIAYGLL